MLCHADMTHVIPYQDLPQEILLDDDDEKMGAQARGDPAKLEVWYISLGHSKIDNWSLLCSQFPWSISSP